MINYKHIPVNYYILFLLMFLIPRIVNSQDKFKKTTTELAHLNKLRVAVEANPNNLQAHQSFIKLLQEDDPLLEEQYKIWMIRFPKLATIPFAIGKAYARAELPKSKDYLLRSVTLKKELAEGWYLLSSDAQRSGNDSLSQVYIENAAKAEPKNPLYAFLYVISNRKINQLKYDSLSLDIVRRFPDSDQAAQSLYWLADYSNNKSVKTAYYQQLFKLYSHRESDWARFGMSAYYDLLINTDPVQAFEHALTMFFQVKKNPLEWIYKLKIAKSFVDARDLLNMHKPEEAMEVLKDIKLKNSFSASVIQADETLLLFKAEAADAAHQTQTAYDSLALYYSKEPSDRVYAVLINYGTKLGLDTIKVNKDIWKIREAGARKAIPFTLENYANEKISLNDYKGKVILLTFWFPGCGPCRAEFPHVESVLGKFNNNEVVYLGINGIRQQDDYVIPLMKATGYSFIPLKEDANRNNENLRAQGYPTNYLIDQSGRIIFSDFRIDESNERMLELMISELLEINKEN